MRANEFISEGIWDKMKSAVGGTKPQDPPTDPININNRESDADSHLAKIKTNRWLSDYDHLTNYNGLDIGIDIQDKLVSVDAYTSAPEGMRVGLVQFSRNGKNLISNQLYVDEKWRGRGIANALYDFAKTQGFNIMASSNQTNDGKAFWKKNRGKERVWEEEVNEMALPTDWDPTELGHDKTFKSRLEYAKNRAPKLGGGSSRIAFTIPDNGRPTVLKIAKNKKGLAQNEAEVDILTDGYIKNLDIVIPLIDYDKVNEQPIWLQTELAQKASEKQLCDIMKSGKYLFHLTTYASSLIGNPDGWAMGRVREHLKSLSSEDLEIFKEYASEIATLLQATNLKYGDLDRAANWGLYKGRPVIIDLGFTDSVAELY